MRWLLYFVDNKRPTWFLLLVALGWWAALIGAFMGVGLLLRACGEVVFRSPPPKNFHKVFDTEEMQEEERFEEWLDDKVEAGEVRRVEPAEDR